MIKEKFKENQEKFYCPMCNRYFESSDYLNKLFENENTKWVSNMVTHYRHNHLTSWNKCWERNGRYYRKGWFKDYETEKAKINERAKRQIIRKCKDFMIANDFNLQELMALKGNTKETLLLFDKLITNQPKTTTPQGGSYKSLEKSLPIVKKESDFLVLTNN